MQCQRFLPRNQGSSRGRLALSLSLVVFAVLFGSGPRTQAQPFTSGSTGADGALNLTTLGVIEFDPIALGLDTDGDNVYHFTTITIGAGVTVRLTARFLDGPVFWLATGAVQIDGTIDLNGEDRQEMPIVAGVPDFTTRRPTIPGAGGYPGGIPGFGSFPPQLGSGPGGGGASRGPGNTASGGGAGHATPSSDLDASCANLAGAAYGNNFLVPLVGGSGGGGGWTSRGDIRNISSGGAGGGAILIASNTFITINGRIDANGGVGIINDHSGGQVSGGSGSGGAIHLLTPIISGSRGISAGGGSTSCRGAPGRIRLEAFQQNFRGSVGPTPVISAPIQVILPAQQPRVRVVSVGGQPVPRLPTASFTTPDVAVNSPTAVPVEIEAHDIPAGTIVKVHAFTENATDQIVDSSPLVESPGNPRVLTATANVTLPPGFSRMFVRATWL